MKSALAAFTLLAAAIPGFAADAPPPRFEIRLIDGSSTPGAESAAVADVNNDGKLDIISAGSWYEAPGWTKHKIRDVPVTSGYVDSFSDLPLDVDGDGFTDVIQIGYFARRIVWMKNPGRAGTEWPENLIEAVGPTEFAFLVDLDNDGRARELLPQFTTAANAPLCWYGLESGKWMKHVVSDRSYGHGIGVGDLNGDRRNDILTPVGWLEAPADPRAAGNWTFHPQPWNERNPTGSTVFETFIRRAGTVIVWSGEVGRIRAGNATAVLHALKVKDPTEPGAIAMGFRLDLSERERTREVYLGGIESRMFTVGTLSLGRASPPIPLPGAAVYTDIPEFFDGPRGLLHGAHYAVGTERGIAIGIRDELERFHFPGMPVSALAELFRDSWVELRLRPFAANEGRYPGPSPSQSPDDPVGVQDPRGNFYIIAPPAPGSVASAPTGAIQPPRPQRPLEFGFMHLADVNFDGRKDLVATDGHNYGIYWFEQRQNGSWTRHEIDRRYSEAHASAFVDLNDDGGRDLVTGKRFQARNQNDPGANEPLGVYWYEYRPGPAGAIDWVRHTISEGGRMGTGLQLRVVDLDGDGDLDVVAPGKSGLFVAERK